MNIYFIIFCGGLIGILLHVMKKMRDINKATPADSVDIKKIVTTYWRRDGFNLIATLFCFGALLFVASEFLHLHLAELSGDVSDPADAHAPWVHTEIRNYIKFFAVITGYCCDSVVYGFLGKTEKEVQAKLPDVKP